MDWKKILTVIGFCAVPLIGGFAVGFTTRDGVQNWYQTLELPAWRPPNWVFSPVWTFLYLSMGFASYLVWRDGNGFKGEARWPLIVYGVMLLLNWAWSPLFFIAHELTGSAVLLTVLTVIVIITGVLFYRINKIAGYLFVPYVAWLLLAGSVSWKIAIDN
ncbi:translocator protein-like [Uranotaenia lowii]|uniref:translocator protein-like n=1 Tax=Uranotaenia lowii TaxID=190385 RepID=UPI002479EF0B|nr:translocator protein-like [Uranotaenia lowii]